METPIRTDAAATEPVAALLPTEATGAARQGLTDTASQRPYDFFGGARFSTEVLATLASANERFAQRLGATLSRVLRLDFQAAAAGIRAGHHRALCQGLTEQAIVHLLDLPPLAGRALLAMDSSLAFVIVDRLMGGPGQGLVENRRDLTDIEREMMQIAYAAIAEAMKAGWADLAQVDPQIGGTVSRASLSRLALPTDPAVVATIDVVVRENHGAIQVILPGPLVQALVSRAGAQAVPEPATQSQGHHQRELKSHLEALSVPVRAVLGTGHLSMQDLIDLRPGDIIRLDSRSDAELDVAIGQQNAYLGRPGRVGEKLAIQITSIAAQASDGAPSAQEDLPGQQAQTKEH